MGDLAERFVFLDTLQQLREAAAVIEKLQDRIKELEEYPCRPSQKWANNDPEQRLL